MPGKIDFVDGEHGPAWIEGPTTALSWLTVLPFKGASAFDRITGARVLASVPFVALVLGGISCVVGWVGVHLALQPLFIAVLMVATLELLNRCMHLDGLADVADALGSYAPPERAREILSDANTGTMATVGMVLSLITQTAAIMSLLQWQQQDTIGLLEFPWPVLFAVFGARIAALVSVHTSRKPMHNNGFAPMMIGTVRTSWIVLWVIAFTVFSTAFALCALPNFHIVCWIVCTLLALLLLVLMIAWCLSNHCERRFEGMNGDTTGFVIHLSTTIFLTLSAIVLPALSNLGAL